MDALNRIKEAVRDEGLSGTAHRLLRYTARRLGFLSDVDRLERHRMLLSEQIYADAGGVVQDGPLAGFKMPASATWDRGSVASMILGFYEQPIIADLDSAPAKYQNLIDIGAADGYIGVGMVRSGRFKRSFCFEITSAGRRLLGEVASQNGVANRVSIKGKADAESICSLQGEYGLDLSTCAVVIDVEGAEFDILSERTLALLRASIVYVELHDGLLDDGEARLNALLATLAGKFSVKRLTQGPRDPSNSIQLDGLHDHERWLLCSEGRAVRQTWLRLSPSINTTAHGDK